MTDRTPSPGAIYSTYSPPFCPNRDCSFHLGNSRQWHYVRDGFFTRPSDQRQFQRFLCRHCGRRFSTRTFSATYWLRRRNLLARVAQTLSNGAALRQAGRILEAPHSTIARHQARLGRHGLLFLAEAMETATIKEPVVVDGFETFEYSQYFPFHINLAAGQSSWFVYGYTDSPLRRKGRMTEKQKRERVRLERELGRPDPRAVETGMADLIGPVLDRSHGPLELHSDEHPAYPPAIRRAMANRPDRQIDHCCTPSVEARTHENPLFAVNLADMLIRHSHANHRRETIAFSKRRMGALDRLGIFVVWRNWIKRRREKKGTETAAMDCGLADRPLKWADVLKRRLFPNRVALPAPWPDYYRRRVLTPVLGEGQTEHQLKYAF